MITQIADIVAHSFQLGRQIVEQRPEKQRKESGQFLTPPAVARFMAQKLGPLPEGARILDPSIGSGVLACAVIERASSAGYPSEIFIEGYEIDAELCEAARNSLEQASEQAANKDIRVHIGVHQGDFILERTPTLQPALFPLNETEHQECCSHYDRIIANPPYFKLNANDPRVKVVAGQVAGHTNIYTLFIGLSIQLLARQGRACFIVPRSFCSGAYFAAFRRDFIKQAVPIDVHLFESRQDTFKNDAVLQENVIITFGKRQPTEATWPRISISTSHSADELTGNVVGRQISADHFLGKRNGSLFFRLPTSELDERIIETVDGWTGSLARYGLKVSTGPVVPFRACSFLLDVEAVAEDRAVPLLWMQNVRTQHVEWPVSRGRKPQAISTAEEARYLLLPAANYVLLRRFSAKEERRRLTAAPFLRRDFNFAFVGLEDHLNYIYRERGGLKLDEAAGLSALLNSSLVDRYFRVSNGNTQVNAAELRALPLPPLEDIQRIGHRISTAADLLVDDIVFSVLRESGCLPADFPLISETRLIMGKIQEAQDVLKTLGMPKAQQNEIAALTLLVLAQLSEETPWGQAMRQSLRIHDMLGEIKERYGREYAENTRETIRRQVIHQLEQAGVVVRNPDDPTVPTNSPRTHYALSEAAIRTMRTYGSKEWPEAAKDYLENQRSLIETYRRQRDKHKVPLVLEGGFEYHLSPGAHNELQVSIIEEFGPYFAPGAKVLYVGDT